MLNYMGSDRIFDSLYKGGDDKGTGAKLVELLFR